MNNFEVLRDLLYNTKPDLMAISKLLKGADPTSVNYALEHLEGAASTYPESALWRVVLFDQVIEGETVKGALSHHEDWKETSIPGLTLVYSPRRLRLHSVNCRGINLTDESLAHAYLSNSDFRGARFMGTYLQDARFFEANLEGALFDDCHMPDIHFNRANLRRSNFHGVNAIDGAFEKADMYGAILLHCDMGGAFFPSANLREVTASGCGFESTSFEGADMSGGDFTNSVFEDSDLVKVNLVGADLTCADLTNANLSGADLRKAILHGVCFKDAKYTRRTRWPDGFTIPSEMEFLY